MSCLAWAAISSSTPPSSASGGYLVGAAPSVAMRLTGTGARVLAGEADHIALNDIDRWIGGVHLQGHRVPWRWDDGTETIIHLPGKT